MAYKYNPNYFPGGIADTNMPNHFGHADAASAGAAADQAKAGAAGQTVGGVMTMLGTVAPPLAIAGAVLGLVSTFMSNGAKAQQEAMNAIFYRRQGDLARDSMFREMLIAKEQYSDLSGRQMSAYAKSGGGGSSALYKLATTAAREHQTLQAIEEKGRLEMDLAYSRGELAQNLSDTYKSPEYNLLTGTTSALSGISNIANAYHLRGQGPSVPGPSNTNASVNLLGEPTQLRATNTNYGALA